MLLNHSTQSVPSTRKKWSKQNKMHPEWSHTTLFLVVIVCVNLQIVVNDKFRFQFAKEYNGKMDNLYARFCSVLGETMNDVQWTKNWTLVTHNSKIINDDQSLFELLDSSASEHTTTISLSLQSLQEKENVVSPVVNAEDETDDDHDEKQDVTSDPKDDAVCLSLLRCKLRLCLCLC